MNFFDYKGWRVLSAGYNSLRVAIMKSTSELCSHVLAFAVMCVLGLGMVIAESAHAQTFTLPDGPLPDGCSASGSDVSCTDDVELDGNDSLEVNGRVSWTIDGDLSIEDDASINAGGSSADLSIQLTGDLELEGRGSIVGSVNSSGNVFLDNDSEIDGDVISGGTVSLASRTEITGCVSASSINNNGTIGCDSDLVLLASATEVEVGEPITLAVAAQNCPGNQNRWRETWEDPDGLGIAEAGPGEPIVESVCERSPQRQVTPVQAGTFNISFISERCDQSSGGCRNNFDQFAREFARDSVIITVSGNQQLKFGQQPTNILVDDDINPSVTVRIEDSDGNLIEDADKDVTLSIAENPNGGVLSGDTTVAAAGGIATFDNLSIDEPGEGYTLEATADTAVSAESAPFTIFDEDLVRISGRIEQLGAGREGVNISVTDQDDVVTGAVGEYSVLVDPDSSVTLTPNHDDLIFCPESREVSVGDLDQSGIHFQAFPNVAGLSGAGTGGDAIYTDDGDIVHVFCRAGERQFSAPEGTTSGDVLVVGGGGGGGTSTSFSQAGSGGGGAGGVVFREDFGFAETIQIRVGDGGAPGNLGNNSGESGEASTFQSTNLLEAIGGGGGIGGNGQGRAGGSGGGSRGASGGEALQPDSDVSDGLGNRGGNSGASPGFAAASGGGGAGSPGESVSGDQDEAGGAGGDGENFAITGGDVFYAGGGGGGVARDRNTPGAGGDGGGGAGGATSIAPEPGFPATGSGGGGGNNDVQGAEGGSGIIVVRYAAPLNPLAEWRMEESQWTGAAGEVADATGNGFNGTMQNDGADTSITNPGPALPGNPGTCRYGEFDGNSYVEIPDFPDLEDSFSITGWFRTRDRSELGQRIFADDETNDNGYAVSLGDGGAGQVRFYHRALNPISLDTPDVIENNTWYFVAAVLDESSQKKHIYIYDASGNLLDHTEGDYTGTLQSDGGTASIGGETSGGETLNRFRGSLDEIRVFESALSSSQVEAVYNTVRPCDVAAVHHIRIDHPGSGVTCSPQQIDLRACANADCSTLFGEPVEVNLTSPEGNWSPDSITIPAQGTATVDLQVPNAGDVTLDAQADPAAENDTRCFDGSTETCNMTWTDSGFLIEIPNHVAATTQSTRVEAVRTDDESLACTPAFENEMKFVDFSTVYINPVNGILPVEIDGQDIPVNGDPEQVELEFNADGVATIDVVYADVGNVQLGARFEGQNDLEQDLIMTGEHSFIARPSHFTLNIPLNKEAVGVADNNVFVAAGENFPIIVSSRNASDDITPNFGQESIPEEVSLEAGLVAPAGGRLVPLSGAFDDFGQDCENNLALGTACGNFNWSEVGVISITPSIASNSYLGSENVVGDEVSNVGRFVPADFDLQIVDHGSVASYCAVNSFAYVGQDLTWMPMAEPLLEARALAVGGTLTENYTESDFLRLSSAGIERIPNATDATEVGVQDDDNDGNDDPLRVTATLETMARTVESPGVMRFTFNEADVFRYLKEPNSRVEPFDPDFHISLEGVTDQDNVISTQPTLPLELKPDFAFRLRYGRLLLDNAYGPETQPLTVPMTVQYLDDDRFVTNIDENCWVFNLPDDATLDFSGSGLNDGDTNVAPVTDGRIVAGAVPAADRLTLSAPGEGNSESPGNRGIEIEMEAPPWLRDFWDSGSPNDLLNPAALATFGVYRGNDRVIYWRER
jgi:MSHA biogenesis protein MshQ